MADFHPMRAPDYSRQTWADKGDKTGFEDPNKSVAYDKQGNPASPAQANNDDDEREGRRGRSMGGSGERVQREPSGATGARSSSISRDRGSSLSIGIPERNGRSDTTIGGAGAAGSGGREVGGRNASMSPSRAMGARSGSIDRGPSTTNVRMYTGLNTLEGIGSSGAYSVNPAALDDRRGRPGYQTEGNSGNLRGRIGSPTGARSISRGRPAIPEAKEDE